jgi:NAD-dependent dihydropyrimidine dehydrogenase PreA subunit
MLENGRCKDLIEHTRDWLFDLPDSEILEPLLELRFTDDEGEFLPRFPHLPSTLEQLSARLEVPADALSEKMQPMIRKGLICEFEGKSGSRYSLTDPIFFFCRMPGWKGEDDEWNRKISPLINRYYIDHLGADFMGHPTKALRAIPIAQTIRDTRQVVPYEDVLEYVDREDYHAVSTCACKHRHNLDPAFAECKHETDVCLHFGKLGRYTVKHGMGKEISPEETLEILKNAADTGLVHGISNTKTGVDTICNCCSCCCLMLEPVKMPELRPGKHQRSNYLVARDEETCKACGLCQKRCPVNAIHLKDKEKAPKPVEGEIRKAKDLKEVVYNPDSCIGCGVCAHKCPTGSLSLIRRTEEEHIPESMSDLGRRMLMERGRDLSRIF